MASTINSDTSNGLILTPDTTGEIELQSAGVTKAKITSSGLQNASGNPITSQAGQNIIINGNMAIDQRNGGSAVTVSSAYTVDRFKFQEGGGGGQVVSVQQVTDAPVGFSNSFKLTNTTASSSITADAYNMFWQAVEGLNWSDLEWGTANAKSTTISFWVKASIAGNYSLAIRSSNNDRSYVTPYTISSANTWEYKTITIAGPTSGTFNTDNTKAIQVAFTHSMGSNYTSSGNNAWQSESKLGATGTQVALSNTVNSTWQVTGVQLEANTTATPFQHLQYGQQLQLCQRYYWKWTDTHSISNAIAYTATAFYGVLPFNTTMRAAPTLSVSAAAHINIFNSAAAVVASAFSGGIISVNSARLSVTASSARTQGQAAWFQIIAGAGKYIQAEAEL